MSLRCGPRARHIYPSLVLVQPRKIHPCLTEKILMGRKESTKTNKHNVTFFGGRGMPDMPHSFVCEAIDWLRGIWFSCKRFCTWSQCVSLDVASVVQILKGVGASTVQ